MSGEWLWFVSRAAGVVSLLGLTSTLTLGVWSTISARAGRTAVLSGVHRNLALGVVVFLCLHIVTAIADGYVQLPWLAVVLPFTAGYERLWVGLGTLALDLLVAVVVTSLLRHRLPERLWRVVHQSTWALWAFAVVHGVALGTSDQPVLRGLSVACAVVGVASAAAWAGLSTSDAARRRQVAAQEWS